MEDVKPSHTLGGGEIEFLTEKEVDTLVVLYLVHHILIHSPGPHLITMSTEVLEFSTTV